MNILIVSFDKSLVSKIKEVLSEHNLVDVKNGEEAVNTVSSYIDVVIYDAVSGSTSEEDINNMYKKKFKDSKYIILVDDLFPVDMNNILPPRKIKLIRDEAIKKIKDAILSEPEAVVGEHLQEIFLQEAPSLEDTLSSQSTYTQDVLSFRELDFEIPAEHTISQIEDVFQKTATEKPLKKVLLVSFDANLINNVKEALSGKVEILEAGNIKEAPEKSKEADIILFDTLSGMPAYKTLTDMSKDESLAKKPYVLLTDELFPIDVESIPLERKYSFAREAEFNKAIEKVLELAEEVSVEGPTELLLETVHTKEFLPARFQPVSSQEEKMGIINPFEGMASSGLEENKPPIFIEEETPKIEVPVEVPEKPVISKGMNHMENITESLAIAIKDVFREQLSQEKLVSLLSNTLSLEELSKQLTSVFERKLEDILKEKVSEAFSKIDVSQIARETKSLAIAIKDVFREQLSQEKLISLLSNTLSLEELSKQLTSVFERKLEDILKEKVSEAFSKIDVSQIVREEAYRVLKEKINELIT